MLVYVCFYNWPCYGHHSKILIWSIPLVHQIHNQRSKSERIRFTILYSILSLSRNVHDMFLNIWKVNPSQSKPQTSHRDMLSVSRWQPKTNSPPDVYMPPTQMWNKLNSEKIESLDKREKLCKRRWQKHCLFEWMKP